MLVSPRSRRRCRAGSYRSLSSVRPLPVIDGLLAATASVRSLTLVTRNARDIAGTGVAVVNPWEPWPWEPWPWEPWAS